MIRLRPGRPPLPFEQLFDELVADAAADVRRRAPISLLTARAFADLKHELHVWLTGVAGQVLAAEFAAFRPAGIRRGGRYSAFVANQRAGGWAALCRGYPALEPLIAGLLEDWRSATAEMLDRLAEDRGRLGTLLGGTLGRVVRVRPGLSDRHGGGRTVAALEFAGGAAVVYKPRPVASEAAFCSLVRWMSERVDAPVRAAWALDRGGYGWMERIDAASCTGAVGAARFHRNAGMLLALLWLLDATDIHYGNLIAAGDDPVVVDLETILQPAQFGRGESSSVLTTGLLPYWNRGPDGELHLLSGLGGGAVRSALTVPRWRAANTDRMALERRPVRVGPQPNQPRLGRRRLPPHEYTAELVDGFRTAGELLRRERQALASGDGPAAGLADLQTRILLRPTITYVLLAEGTLGPALLRDPAAREAALASTAPLPGCGRRARERIALAECDAVRRLDIPRFHVAAAGRDLWEGGTRIASRWAAESGLAAMMERLLGLDRGRLSEQARLIGASCALAALSDACPRAVAGDRRAHGDAGAVSSAGPDLLGLGQRVLRLV